MTGTVAVIDGVADAMLFIAAIFVTYRALKGARAETKAEKMPAGDDKDTALADARTYYAAASLTRPWVLWFVFLGTAAKALLTVADWLDIIP